MKKFLQAISGKTALVIFLIIVVIGTILDIVTSMRMGTKFNYYANGIIYCLIAIWADSLKKKEDK